MFKGRASTSSASGNDSPCNFIRKEMTSPPSPQPKHLYI